MNYICSACGKHHENVRNYVCINCSFVNPLPIDINYFTYFSIPCSFAIDINTLKVLYQELIVIYHPDNHVANSEDSNPCLSS